MIKVNNTYLGSDLPIVDVANTTPDQIFRCTDNTIFRPTLIIITNKDAAATRLLLVDADLDDDDEHDNEAETCAMLDVNVGASSTVILEGDKIPSSLQFKYGVAGYSTNGASSELRVYIEGTEHFTSTTS